jgi:hypothetical protein
MGPPKKTLGGSDLLQSQLWKGYNVVGCPKRSHIEQNVASCEDHQSFISKGITASGGHGSVRILA